MQPDDPGLRAEEKRKLLDRILASKALAKKPVLALVLRHLVDMDIEDRPAEHFKDAVIDAELFRGRRKRPGTGGANSRTSNARVTVRNLRKALGVHYRTEGVPEEIALVLEKGFYRPRWIRRYRYEENETWAKMHANGWMAAIVHRRGMYYIGVGNGRRPGKWPMRSSACLFDGFYIADQLLDLYSDDTTQQHPVASWQGVDAFLWPYAEMGDRLVKLYKRFPDEWDLTAGRAKTPEPPTLAELERSAGALTESAGPITPEFLYRALTNAVTPLELQRALNEQSDTPRTKTRRRS